MMTEEELTESAREHFEERAGILEFDSGLPREEAERLARKSGREFIAAIRREQAV